jgi:4-amino-4-deoxy-L-arabinose transferase-like glycosyltransferase
MFDASNGGQIGWLLPLAVGGGLLALWNWRRDPARRAFAVLFLGWIGIYGGVFSYAHGIFHSYYTSAMAPGVAALVGIGSVAAANAIRQDKRWLVAVLAIVGVTVWTQLQIEGRTPDFYGWVRPLTLITALAGMAGVSILVLRGRPVASRMVTAGIALTVAGLLLLPAAWSVSASVNPSLNATLPQAGPQTGTSGQTFGSASFNDGTADLAAWLKAQSDGGTTWQLVVPSSQNGSRLIAQYGLSVMSLGGFLGRDNTISVSGFADLVASGEVRYVLTSQGGPGGGGGGATGRIVPNGGADGRGNFGGPGVGADGGSAGTTTASNAVVAAVQTACTAVTEPTLPTAYQGSLYDCAGAAAALRQ